MRHLVDLYLIRCSDSQVPDWKSKELAFTDFYHRGRGMKYGAVLSFGELPAFTYVVNRPPLNLKRRLFRAGKSWLSPLWNGFRSRRLTLAGILEDLPYAANRVLPPVAADGSLRVRFQYRVHPDDSRRMQEFRRLVRASLAGRRVLTLKGEHQNEAVDHACGTCRFGNDPRITVLDRMNRAHGLDNLYVCDASFFPSSAGMPPALTIAANALRVGAHLVDRL
jgi:choline dehydrogenase-like flavoprotein